jgi:hypothetical protein
MDDRVCRDVGECGTGHDLFPHHLLDDIPGPGGWRDLPEEIEVVAVILAVAKGGSKTDIEDRACFHDHGVDALSPVKKRIRGYGKALEQLRLKSHDTIIVGSIREGVPDVIHAKTANLSDALRRDEIGPLFSCGTSAEKNMIHDLSIAQAHGLSTGNGCMVFAKKTCNHALKKRKCRS